MKESEIQSFLLDALHAMGCWARQISGTATGGKGIPDILACLPGGRFLAIEVKRQGGYARPEQTQNIDKITSIGGKALFVEGMTEARALIRHLILEVIENGSQESIGNPHKQ